MHTCFDLSHSHLNVNIQWFHCTLKPMGIFLNHHNFMYKVLAPRIITPIKILMEALDTFMCLRLVKCWLWKVRQSKELNARRKTYYIIIITSPTCFSNCAAGGNMSGIWWEVSLMTLKSNLKAPSMWHSWYSASASLCHMGWWNVPVKEKQLEKRKKWEQWERGERELRMRGRQSTESVKLPSIILLLRNPNIAAVLGN